MLFPHLRCARSFVVSPTSTVTNTRHTLRLSPSSAPSRAIFIRTMLSSTLAKKWGGSLLASSARCLAFCHRIYLLPSRMLRQHWRPSKNCMSGGWRTSSPPTGNGNSHELLYHLKTTTLRLLPMIRSRMTIPLGSIISITGKSNSNRALEPQTRGSRTCRTTRTMNNSLPTLTSMLALLLRWVSGTAGSQPGTTTTRQIPICLIGRGFQATTGQFSRMAYTSLGRSTVKLPCNNPLT